MSATFAAMLIGETSPGLFQWRGDPTCDLIDEARAAGWQALGLDTSEVRDADQLYEAIATGWDLPAWFGRNLDALWDVLGDLTTSPLVVVWEGCADLAAVDPQLAQTVLELFRDASTQATAFSVIVRDAPGSGELGVSGLDGLL